jgi:hypothetical protein
LLNLLQEQRAQTARAMQRHLRCALLRDGTVDSQPAAAIIQGRLRRGGLAFHVDAGRL